MAGTLCPEPWSPPHPTLRSPPGITAVTWLFPREQALPFPSALGFAPWRPRHRPLGGQQGGRAPKSTACGPLSTRAPGWTWGQPFLGFVLCGKHISRTPCNTQQEAHCQPHTPDLTPSWCEGPPARPGLCLGRLSGQHLRAGQVVSELGAALRHEFPFSSPVNSSWSLPHYGNRLPGACDGLVGPGARFPSQAV